MIGVKIPYLRQLEKEKTLPFSPLINNNLQLMDKIREVG
jgi:hypothetical protein